MKKFNFLLCLLWFVSIPELASAQVLSFSPQPLNLVAQAGTQTVQGTLTIIGSFNGSPISFSLAQESSWLQVSTPTTWQTPATITVTANLSLLPAGTTSAQGSIVFFNPNAGNLFTYQSVPVNLSVSTLTVSPLSVGFLSYLAGSSTFPPSQTLSVTGGTFSIGKASADNWYTAAISGSPANAVLVSVDQAALPSLTAGAYAGTLTITPTGVSNPVPVNVPVSLTVAAAPVVSVTPSGGLSFEWQVNGTNNQAQQSLTLTSSDPLSFPEFTATASAPWIKVRTANPGGYLGIVVDGTGLAAQSAPYTGTVTVALTDAVFANGQSSLSIPVSLNVSNFPLINVSTAGLSFSYQFGSGSAVQAAAIYAGSTASPANELQYTVGASSCTGGNWLAMPAGLQTTGTAFSVSVNPTVLATLPPETYTCNLTVTPAATGSGTAQQGSISIPVTLNVTNTPTLVVSSNALVFAYQTGLTPAAAATAAQTIAITSNSGAPLSYSVSVPSSASAPWLQVTGNLTGTTDQTSIAVGVIPGSASSGTSDATITVTATDPAGVRLVGAQFIDVKLYVSNSPLLTVTPPGPITLTGTLSQSQPQQIALASTDPASPLTTAVQFTDSGNWLSYNQPPVTTPGSFTIFGTPAGGMTPGSYAGTITISATGAGNTAAADSPYVVPVTFQYNQAAVSVSPASLSFSQPFGGQADTAKQVSVATSGAVLPFTAVANDGAIGWLSVTSGSGSTPGSFSVSADASRLTSGTYYGAVYVTAPNAGQVRIPVTFTVAPGTISASTTPLNFTQVAGGSAPAAQTVAVQGTAGLNFTVSTAVTSPANGTWLSATVGSAATTSGQTPANVQISVNAGSLAPATYTGTVTITSPGATGSPISIPVNLTVVAAATLTVSPTSLSYSYVIGGSVPAAQTAQLGSSAVVQYAVSAKTADGGNWLAVTPTQGQIGCYGIPTGCLTSGTLSVTINPLGLMAGSYTGTITASSPSALTTATVNVSLLVISMPAPVITGIQNAASYTTGAVSPGENIVIYGTGIGPAQMAVLQLTSTGTVATLVAGTQVFFDSNPAPIIYASANQTSVMVPEEVAGRSTTQITVVYQGLNSAPLSYYVASANPGIYTENMMGTGPGSILNQDYSVNGPTKPAAKGSYVQVYLTGTGDTTPLLATGAVNPSNGSGLKTSAIKYAATVGGLPATVAYQGTAPGFVEGVMQFNIQIPDDAPSGAQPIVIQAGTSTTVVTFATQTGVTVQVQ